MGSMKPKPRKLDRSQLLRNAYPNLSEEERRKSDDNLRRFLDLCLRMHQREEQERREKKCSGSD